MSAGPCAHCGHRYAAHSTYGSRGCDHYDRTYGDCSCPVYMPLPVGPTVCLCGHTERGHSIAGHRPCQMQFTAGGYCSCVELRFPETPELSEEEPPIEKEKRMASKTATPKKYTLPDGREYLTRALGGYDDDVVGLRDLAKRGIHTLLLSEPGAGKTALVQAAFPDSENEIGHSKLTAWDMLWRPRPMPDGTVTFDPSPLTRAVMNGKPFYLDELMRASEDSLTPLFSAMDGRGFIVGGNLDGTDMPVKKGFVVIGASNPLVRGAFLPDAIASRFHILTVETSEELLVRMKLDDRLLVAWRNLSNMDGGETWRPSIREMLAAQRFIDAGNMPQAAYALTGWRVTAKDRSVVAGVIAPLLGVRVNDLGGIIK